MRRLAFALAVALVTGPLPAVAQTNRIEVPSPILTVDQERLFTDSAWGRRVQAELAAQSRDLNAENRAIEDELVAEEQALTDLRATISAEEFRDRAAAFNEKVVGLRDAQDSKSRELAAQRDAERQRFFSSIVDILAKVVSERGAVAILDQRAIVLSVSAVDITDEAIARIDVTLTDGSQ